MSTLNVCRKSANSENIITCQGRISWCRVAQPSEKGNYELSLICPSNSDLTVLKNAIKAVLDENQTAEQQKKTKYNMPIRKTSDYPSLVDYEAEYPIVITANSKYKPQVITAGKVEVGEADLPDEVYSGRCARMSVSPKYYPPVDGGKPGVKLYLQNIQVLDHAEPIGSSRVKAENDFDAVGEETTDSIFD